VSSRTFVTVGIIAAVLLVGWWRLLAPGAEHASDSAADGVEQILGTTTEASFTGAAATLAVQRSTTGSYVGARLAPRMTLVRADATSYCVQTQAGTDVQHLAGPGGTPPAGPC
jgi:hypothetical protein